MKMETRRMCMRTMFGYTTLSEINFERKIVYL